MHALPTASTSSGAGGIAVFEPTRFERLHRIINEAASNPVRLSRSNDWFVTIDRNRSDLADLGKVRPPSDVDAKRSSLARSPSTAPHRASIQTLPSNHFFSPASLRSQSTMPPLCSNRVSLAVRSGVDPLSKSLASSTTANDLPCSHVSRSSSAMRSQCHSTRTSKHSAWDSRWSSS